MYTTASLPIKAWAEEDRPREKMQLKGRNALSDAELLAILIGSGNRQKSAVELSKEILNLSNNNLNQLGKCRIDELMEIKGIGMAKAITIVAALELGRRRKESDALKAYKVQCSKDAYRYMLPKLEDLDHEEFWVMCLTSRNEVMSHFLVSRGGVASTVVDHKMIFAKALKQMAPRIMLFHNHPSGNPRPSAADKQMTYDVVAAGKLLDIQVIDHIIVGDKTFYSFADHNLI